MAAILDNIELHSWLLQVTFMFSILIRHQQITWESQSLNFQVTACVITYGYTTSFLRNSWICNRAVVCGGEGWGVVVFFYLQHNHGRILNGHSRHSSMSLMPTQGADYRPILFFLLDSPEIRESIGSENWVKMVITIYNNSITIMKKINFRRLFTINIHNKITKKIIFYELVTD
jgi:hypothetical protein